MGHRRRRSVARALVASLAGTAAVSLAASLGAAAAGGPVAGPALNAAKLKSCLAARGGAADATGIRSTAYAFDVALDPTVTALVVVSGVHPLPSVTTRRLVTGHRPILTRRFTNVRIDAYVLRRQAVRPRPGAIASAASTVTAALETCTAAARATHKPAHGGEKKRPHG